MLYQRTEYSWYYAAKIILYQRTEYSRYYAAKIILYQRTEYSRYYAAKITKIRYLKFLLETQNSNSGIPFHLEPWTDLD